MKSPSKALAEFAVSLKYEDLPSQVIDHLKLCIIDTLGVGLLGSRTPWCKILLKLIEKEDLKKESTVWGHKTKVSCINAALINGTAGHSFELDDYHRLAIMHPGPISLPPALAVTERVGAVDGRDLLAAIAASYEVSIRVGISVGVSHLLRGYHPEGTVGTFGAVVAAGKILGLSENEMLNALGIAGTQASGLMAAQYAAMVKRMHAGRACQSGVISALLAQEGFTGIANILEAEYGGFCKTMSDQYDLNKITENLGKVYEISNVSIKPYACSASCFTSIDAMKGLMKKHLIKPELVEKIVVRASTATKKHVGWDYKPESVTGAQMNLPFGVAVFLLKGNAFIDQYTEDMIRDKEVLSLIRKIEVKADPEIDKSGPKYRHSIIMEIHTKDGRIFSSDKVDFPKGSPENPMSKEEVLWKFNNLASRVLTKEHVKKIINLVYCLEEMDNVLPIIELLRA